MELPCVTTPFGRRPMTFGMLASQIVSRSVEPDRSIDKWKLYRALCEARPLLGVTDRALAVLNALLSFYPKNELSKEHGLIVFPSNHQLSLRAHGMAEQTIRRHLAALVEAGLLIRKDSPNGKRYARRNRAGEVNEAFGFSLAPLLARAEEIEHLAARVVAERLYLQSLRERVSLCRRDIAKLIDVAHSEELAGDWESAHDLFRALIDSLPRSPDAVQLATLLDKLELLRAEIVNQLENQTKARKQSGNHYQNERHIQNSHPDSSFESEIHQRTETRPLDQKQLRSASPQLDSQDEDAEVTAGGAPSASSYHKGESLKQHPLSLVLRACPEVRPYGPGGSVSNWRDLMSAAVVIRSMLGVSPSAYGEACAVMGPQNAAIVMACMLERGEHINCAGGYLRELTRRCERGEFTIEPMLMALARSNNRKEKGPTMMEH
ncbi:MULTISPECIES: plasmid replication protein RepC [unclassified Sinorhizobium]|uniref:plasmid replication protein RepC n=1 Tax=unclassified Sinorhizobium TaxID=2613772 RepID=UPI0035252FC3